MRPRPTCPTYSLFVLLLLTALFSCKKEHHTAPGSTEAPANVYVLGVQDGEVLYWKNGVASTIPSSSGFSYNFAANALTTAGDNVYIAGFQPGSTGNDLYRTVPSYWLNGAATTLPDSTGSVAGGSAAGVAVSGSDVYLAGIRGYDGDTSHVPYTTETAAYPITGGVATVWKNGKPVSLPDFGSVGLVDSAKYAARFYSDYTSGIYVTGTNVYVSGGSYYTLAHARYWENGNPVDLTGNLYYMSGDGNYGTPTTTSIYASGSDVYVSGFQSTTIGNPVAIYWKNGSPLFLSTDSLQGSMANAVVVSGTDVYVAGWQNIGNYSRAMLWKNGIADTLTSGNTSSTGTSLFVSGSDVYVAGYTWMLGGHYIATYWKNGAPVSLSDGTQNAIAYSISVQ
jgi:hypothetical protein